MKKQKSPSRQIRKRMFRQKNPLCQQRLRDRSKLSAKHQQAPIQSIKIPLTKQSPVRDSLKSSFEIPDLANLVYQARKKWANLKINKFAKHSEIHTHEPFVLVRFQGFGTLQDLKAFRNEYRNAIEPFMFRQKPFCLLINISRFPIQHLSVISELIRTTQYAFEKGMKGKINLIDRRFLPKYWISRFFLILQGLSSGISFFGSELEAKRRLSERYSLSSLPETGISS